VLGDCSPVPVLDSAPTAELLEPTGVPVNYLHFGDNRGHGGGHNALMAGATEDLVLLVNPDTVLAPDLLRELVLAMTRDVGACEGRQVPFEHPKQFDAVTGETPWASGACLLMRTSVYREVGGFDAENFFLHVDDVDLGWRIRLAGHRILHVPSAAIFHDKRLTSAGAVDTTGDTERYESHLGAMMLARKWGRPDISNHFRYFCAGADDVVLNAAAKEWDFRAAAGRLPLPVEGAENVAQFVGNYYAEHRF
jgi:GT2 family glycosyltransferase